MRAALPWLICGFLTLDLGAFVVVSVRQARLIEAQAEAIREASLEFDRARHTLEELAYHLDACRLAGRRRAVHLVTAGR